jgi:NitT/TauT family transport system substrate-binding protein
MRTSFTGATAAILAVTAATAARAESFKVAIPQKGLWDTSIVGFGVKQGFFKQEGLDIENVYTHGGAATAQAVISGTCAFGMANGLLGIIGAYVKGAPVRVISAEMTGAPDLYWYAKAGSGIKSLKDAAGKTAGYSSPGSSTNLVLLALIKQAGVNIKPVPTGGIPATFTQVMSGQIDLGWSVPPNGLEAEQEGKIAIVAHGNDVPAIRHETVRVNVVNADVLKNQRDAVIRFARAYAKSLDWAYKNPKAIDEFAEGMKVSRQIAQKARDEFYPRAAMNPDKIEGLDLALKQAHDFKFIPKPMKPADIKGLFQIVYRTNGK